MAYAGDVTCEACWEALKAEPAAQLIDVRTSAEWSFVGYPVLDGIGKQVLFIEWQQYPSMNTNPDFTGTADQAIQAVGGQKTANVFTLCRSGVRSISAAEALTAAGYQNVYNVLGGFEGNTDASGHRSMIAGWKFDGLPWMQK